MSRSNQAPPENPRNDRESISAGPSEQQDAHNERQKSFFGRVMDTLDAPGHYLVEKPVSWITRSRTAGKVAKYLVYAGLLGAAGYYLPSLLRSGAEVAYRGGETILDRVGPGGGLLYPPMDMPSAYPGSQALPPVDSWGTS